MANLKRRSGPNPVKDPKTPIVDGDTLVYKACMAAQYTMHHIIPKGKRNPVESIRYKTELKKYLEENNIVLDGKGFTHRIVEEEIVEPIENVLHTCKVILQGLEETFGEEPIVFLSGTNNYRDYIATELPYKGNRWSVEQRQAALEEGKWLYWLGKTEKSYVPPVVPFHKQEVRQYLIRRFGAKVTENIEADDAQGILLTKMGSDAVMCAEDKDLMMIPGYHFNPYKEDAEVEYVTQLEGWRQFYKQLLMGDNIDNIPGVYGIGEGKALAALEYCVDAEDMFAVVKEIYQETYGALWHKRMTERGQLLWVMREVGSIWVPPTF